MLEIALTLLVGCANGPWYWIRPGATDAMFLADHQPCFETATIGYEAGSEARVVGQLRHPISCISTWVIRGLPCLLASTAVV